MITAKYIENFEDLRIGIPTFDIGKRDTLSSSAYSVLIESDSNPLVVIKIYLFDEPKCFNSVKYNDQSIVIGCGGSVHFYDLRTNKLTSVRLKGYFGHLYSDIGLEVDQIYDSVLVADASKLYKFSSYGKLLWESEFLAIDGVVVNDVDGDIILGEGEQDPPGGWESFKLAYSTGKSI